MRAFTHLDGFRGGSSLATWLPWIVSNEALGRLRRRHPTVDIIEVEETLAADAGAFTTTPPTPEQAIARREVRSAIEKAVDELPPYFRSVFMLRAIEQMSVEETASCLGIPSDTVKTRFFRLIIFLSYRHWWWHLGKGSSVGPGISAHGALRCRTATAMVSISRLVNPPAVTGTDPSQQRSAIRENRMIAIAIAMKKVATQRKRSGLLRSPNRFTSAWLALGAS